MPQESTAFDGKAFVRTLGQSPGVYRFYTRDDELLYVGKAANLKKRVGSYFLRPSMQPRIAAMVDRIARVQVTVTRTASEALLLESQLIKSLKPRYNIMLRDDKSYPWIHLSGHDDFPRLSLHRGPRNKPGEYFGPYPSAGSVRQSLSLLHKLFKVRQCEDSYFNNRSRPCLQYQIGRCSAPCVHMISAEDYRRDVRHLRMFLKGQSSEIIDEMGAAMDQASERLDFEGAARLRDQIASLRTLYAEQHVRGSGQNMDLLDCQIEGGVACVSVLSFRNGINLGSRDFFPRLMLDHETSEVLGQFIAQHYLDNPMPEEIICDLPPREADLLATALSAHRDSAVTIKTRVRGVRARFLAMAERNAHAALKARMSSRQSREKRWQDLANLLELEPAPTRIECFDISHTRGEATVASCVVFGPDGPLKSHYRLFNIQGIQPGDDYAAMHSALTRRFRRLAEGQGERPDVLLIDGGKGQVKQAVVVMEELGLTGIRIVGVAKGPTRRAGQESLVLATSNRLLRPGPHSPALHLVDEVRDEAHRFAITGHRRRRAASRQRSTLEGIPGIGAQRRATLLRAFGGLEGLRAAGVEELSTVRGISRHLAQKIYNHLHD